MGLWENYCGDTSLHGYQYIGRREKRPFWVFALIISYILAIWLIGLNTSDYLDSTTTTNLESSTSSLNNVFYPSVTVCNTNQIREDEKSFHLKLRYSIETKIEHQLNLHFCDTL